MTNINSIDAYEKALDQSTYSVMVFYSRWCIDCITVKPALKRLEAIYPEFDFYWVNREDVAQLSNHLNIYGVPSLLFYDKDQIKNTWISKNPKPFAALKKFLDACLNDV